MGESKRRPANKKKKEETTKPKATLTSSNQEKNEKPASASASSLSSSSQGVVGWKVAVLGVVPAVLTFWILFINNNNHRKQPITTAKKNTSNNNDHTITQQWIDLICKVSYCHESLSPVGRTLQANQDIPPGQPLLRIPPSFQLYDVDVFRHEAIRPFLKKARHEANNHPLIDSGAFFALYFLWHEKHRDDNTAASYKKKQLVDYFSQVLPTHDDHDENNGAFASHPIFWSDEERNKWIPAISPVYAWSKGFSDMIESEYRLFRKLESGDKNSDSNTFLANITLQKYKTMRLAVLTRSLSNYPIQTLFGDKKTTEKSKIKKEVGEELWQYYDWTGIDLTQQGNNRIVMVAVAELLNHHLNAPATWTFDDESSSTNTIDFVVYSRAPIPAGQEIFMPYGQFTLSWLYSKFGFVNGDGSGPIMASLAVHHHVVGETLWNQFGYAPLKQEEVATALQSAMMEYLRYDDGYEKCIAEGISSERDIQLKHLKNWHLLRIAQVKERWHFNYPPRNVQAVPVTMAHNILSDHNIRQPPRFDNNHDSSPNNGSLPNKLLFTCRLITLHSEDFGGRAVEALHEAYTTTNEPLEPKFQSKESEYRTIQCIRRLVRLAKAHYSFGDGGASSWTTEETYSEVARLSRDEPFGRDWSLAHVRLSELQVLDAIDQSAAQFLKKFEVLDVTTSPLFIVRQEPCEIS